MGSIIEWADWAAAQEAIKQTSQAVSGMSPAEAEAALNWSKTTLKDGTVRYIHNASSGAGGSNITQFPGASASDAFNSYIGDGGLASSGGAAVSNPPASQSSNLTMLKGASGTAGIGAVLSMNLPTAAAAIAPLAGVALGAGLYELAPEFWEKISRALLPFCYDDTELLPVVADEEGNTYFPKEAVDAVKNVIGEELQGENVVDQSGLFSNYINENTVNPFPFRYAKGVTSLTFTSRLLDSYTGKWYENIKTQVSFKAPVNIVLASLKSSEGLRADSLYIGKKGNSSVTGKITTERPPGTRGVWWMSFNSGNENIVTDSSYIVKDSVNFYYQYERIDGNTSYFSSCEIIDLSIACDTIEFIGRQEHEKICGSIAYGEEIVNYPSGTEKWSGAQYPASPSAIEVVTSIDGETVTTQPYYPISTPIGDPGASANPDVTPDITKNPNPGPAITPWITPAPNPSTYPDDVPQSNPAPLPDPVPDYTPNLNPDNDPSQEPAQQPESAPQNPKPGDSGTSPTPQIPIIPFLPSATTGLLHVYNPTQAQLDSFGSWLWTTFSGDLIDTLSKLFNDPMDAVIGLHELYATPAVSGQSTIRAGHLDSGVASNIVGSRYTSINCGSVVVPEFYGNYLDYSPYTKCYIYLPFIGIVPILADDIIGNAINITYHIDSYTGCCIAVITVAREGYSSTVYQFEGNCGVEIPITSGYQSTLVGAMLGIAGTAISGSPHVGLAASNLGRANLGKNDASHSGSFGASYGAMGAKIPYIIVKRPTQKSVVNYNEEYGFPAHTRVTIGACSGYLRAREVHVISPTATDEEKARIEELLKGGVFVK